MMDSKVVQSALALLGVIGLFALMAILVLAPSFSG